MSGVVTRPAVKELTRWQLAWTAIALWVCFAVVGGSAAFSSFTHIVHVSRLAHQDGWVAYAMPLSIDGMMAIASVAHYRDRMTGRHPRGWGWFALWFGLGLSIYANGASYVAVWGWQIGWLVWACLPPALLLISIEVMSKPGRVREVAELVVRASDTMRATISDATRTEKPAAPAESEQAPANAAAETPAQPATVGVAGSEVRRGRPIDDEPLSPQLVALALKVGRARRDRTGQVVTRDQLRSGLRDAGWRKGISNVTAGRLLDLIRNDIANNGGEDQGAAEVQSVDQAVSEDLATANGRA